MTRASGRRRAQAGAANGELEDGRREGLRGLPLAQPRSEGPRKGRYPDLPEVGASRVLTHRRRAQRRQRPLSGTIPASHKV